MNDLNGFQLKENCCSLSFEFSDGENSAWKLRVKYDAEPGRGGESPASKSEARKTKTNLSIRFSITSPAVGNLFTNACCLIQ